MEELVAFGLKVKQLRESKNLSQEELAERCELDRTYISRVETAKRNPSLSNVFKIAAGLEVPPSSLFDNQ